ncbi:MAG: BON domain-containing protein [Planctomycetes bacterium]|nr:BON domain-containing protein [Planctomycetota bacterium]
MFPSDDCTAPIEHAGAARENPLAAATAAALNALRTSPYLPLRSLKCSERRGVITIQGSVPTYYLKQLAQTLVRQIPTSRRIENQIEVVPPGNRFSSPKPG